MAPAAHDPLWQFPNLFTSDSHEGLFSHYERLVSADFDSTTGVSTLKVQAFSPEDARRLTKALLDDAEALVNRLNERARRDAISIAEAAPLLLSPGRRCENGKLAPVDRADWHHQPCLRRQRIEWYRAAVFLGIHTA
jgi:hypothetical protein